MARSASLLGLLLAACAAEPAPLATPTAWTSPPADPIASEEPAASNPLDPATAPAEGGPVPDLEIRFLGVGGYLVEVGDDAILFPPMYSNPDLLETTFGDVASDPVLVDRFSRDLDLSRVSAILVGHAHYDHLMDAPTLWPRTGDATFYVTETGKHILAAFDRDPSCEPRPADAPALPFVPRDRVVELNDPAHDVVDYRPWPERDPGFGTGDGEWVTVPGANVRFRALMSHHADQVGPFHFGPGRIDEDLCDPPAGADDWKEGTTVAYLVDFLDADGVPTHRVYYQDAPTSVPLGLPHPSLLSGPDGKTVDVALLNVGTFDVVEDHPGGTLAVLRPRYTIGGHWEDFFRNQGQRLVPIIGHDLDEYQARAEAEMPVGEQPLALVDGEPSDARQWVPDPGTPFRFRAEGREAP